MINLIIDSLADLIALALGFFVDKICEIFGFSFELFNASFPYAAVAYSYIRSIALGITLLLATWQLVSFYFGGNKRNTSPLRIGLHTILAVFMIYYGNYILEAIMDIAQSPYNALMGIDTVSLDIDFMTVENVISSIFIATSTLLYLVVLLLVGIQFLRLLLEAVERYAVLFGLVYLSPLFSASIATEETSGIFGRYFSMFIAQCLLLILNVWSLKMVCSLFDNLPTADVQFLALMLGYAFMRFAAKLDSYIGQLGLSVATTGAGLGAEIFASGAAIASMMTGKFVGGKARGSQNGSGSGTVLGQDQEGFAGNLSNALGMVSPVSGAAQGVQNAAGAAFKTGASGFSAAGSAFMSTNGNIGEKFSAGVGAFKDRFGQNIQDNLHDASMTTQGSSLWARTILKTGNNAIDGMAKSLKDGTVLNSQQLHDLANNPWIAQKLNDQLTASGTEVNDPGVVAAMGMGMIGANNMSPEMMQAYQAGTGAIEAENLNYTSDASGIHQSWSYNGKDNTLDLLNKAQYNQLPTEQQAAFTAYRAANGATMYAAYNSGKTPTDKQKMNRDAQNNIGDFFRSGGTASLSGSAREGIRSNAAIWSVYQNGLRTTGTRIDGSTPEGAAAIQASVAGIKGLNNQEVRRAQTAAIDHLTKGTYDPDRTYMDGNTISVGWTDADGAHTLSFVTPEGMDNMDTSGYTQGNFDTYSMNGTEGIAHYDRPMTSNEQAEQELDTLVNPVGSTPNGEPMEEPTEQIQTPPNGDVPPELSETTRAELKSHPEMVRKVQADLGKQNTVMQNAPEVAAASLNMLDLKSSPEIRDVRTAINKGIDNGKVVSSQVSAHSSEIVVKDGNREWKMAEMDQQAVQESGMTAPQLAEAGFERVTDKSGAYRYVSATNPMQNAVEKFAQNPTENPIPKEIWAELGQPKNQQYVQQIFSSMEKHGTELKYTPETAETYANMVEAMAPTLQNAGVSKNSVLEAASSLRNVEDGMVDVRDLSFNGRGLNINHQRGEIENQIVFMTESGVKRVQETNNIRGSDSRSQVESILDNKGYHHINQSGKDYYVLNKGGRIKGNAEQRRFRRETN